MRKTIDQYTQGTRHLSGLGEELAYKYIKRLEQLGADCIVLPGDCVDPCTPDTLDIMKSIFQSVAIPCHPMIGNHEPWSPSGENQFYATLGLSEGGYYAVRRNKVLMLFLSTPDQNALCKGSSQLRWFEEQLTTSYPDDDVIQYKSPCGGFRDANRIPIKIKRKCTNSIFK